MLNLISVFILFLHLANGIVVKLPDGEVQGITDTTLAGTTYHSFLAMRYAEPPVGDLRFEPSQPVKPWSEVYDATAEKHVCYQVQENSVKENEDCLFINVFTPKDLSNTTKDDLAVMVFIHGGGFIQGAGYIREGGVGPKFFMDNNVVLVAPNYRLGPFGFASTGDNILPGNLGLKDQTLALEWVQKNIKYFGGDPKKVTIFGQSAGSASVSYHLLSPKSNGLFRAAILESGSSLSPWAYQRYQVNITFETATLIDPSFQSPKSDDLLTFLKSVPASAIDNASQVLSQTRETPADYQISKGFFYAPVIEVPHDGAFLTENMYGIFENGSYNKVPILAGMTSEESVALVQWDMKYQFETYDNNPEILVPFDMHIDNDQLKKTIGKKIKDFFANNGFENDLAAAIRYHSVHDFDKSEIKQAELMSKYTDVYFYEFSYKGLMGNCMQIELAGTGNVTHAEELNYIFSKWYSDSIPDNTNLNYFPEADRKVHNRMITMWTDFAKYLDPTPSIDHEILQNVTWTPVTPSEFRYLDIGEDLVLKTGYPKSESYVFWKDLYDEYAVKPLDSF